MKYTPSQFRDAVGITQETLRHWRRVLPVYADRIGYSPAFTISDLIVGVIIKRLRSDLGVSVSRLAEISQKLGLACDQSSWENLECSTIFLDIENQNCSLHSRSSIPHFDGLQVVLPLDPVLRQISDALMQSGENNQPTLSLSLGSAAVSLRHAGKV